MMTSPLKTKAQAAKYAAQVEAVTGEPQLVFRVLPGTRAYECGFRFGTCAASERAEYEACGALFVEVTA